MGAVFIIFMFTFNNNILNIHNITKIIIRLTVNAVINRDLIKIIVTHSYNIISNSIYESFCIDEQLNLLRY